MMSPLSFLVMLLIMIIIPTILYSFFFLMTCPPNPFNLFRRRPNEGSKSGEETDGHDDECKKSKELMIVASSKLPKDAECPVCLAAFVEGEEVRQLNMCKHFFHSTCIDKWLSSHFNCPVCRAFVGNHSSKERERSRVLVRDHAVARDDFWQGLPGAAGLV